MKTLKTIIGIIFTILLVSCNTELPKSPFDDYIGMELVGSRTIGITSYYTIKINHSITDSDINGITKHLILNKQRVMVGFYLNQVPTIVDDNSIKYNECKYRVFYHHEQGFTNFKDGYLW